MSDSSNLRPVDRREDNDDAHSHACGWCGKPYRCRQDHSNGKNGRRCCYACSKLTLAELFARYPAQDPLAPGNRVDGPTRFQVTPGVRPRPRSAPRRSDLNVRRGIPRLTSLELGTTHVRSRPSRPAGNRAVHVQRVRALHGAAGPLGRLAENHQRCYPASPERRCQGSGRRARDGISHAGSPRRPVICRYV